MSELTESLLGTPQVDLMPEAGPSCQLEDLRTQVWSLLSTLYPRQELGERRDQQRYPFPYLIHLTPVGPDGETPCGETLVVVGKHLSVGGMGFYHPQPIPFKRMIVSLESRGTWLGFLLELSWCRFTKHRWYESGGRLVKSVTSPLAGSEIEV